MTEKEASQKRSKFPPLYWLVVLFEFFERGSYYGVMSILSVYLVDELNFAKQDVGLIKGTIQPLLYFLPILAGALAEAGGLLAIEADEGSIKLIRGSWQEPIVYTLKYETILSHGDRIFLEPGDRVVVQPTGLTTASRYMQQILPFLQAADSGTAIYDRLTR